MRRRRFLQRLAEIGFAVSINWLPALKPAAVQIEEDQEWNIVIDQYGGRVGNTWERRYSARLFTGGVFVGRLPVVGGLVHLPGPVPKGQRITIGGRYFHAKGD